VRSRYIKVGKYVIGRHGSDRCACINPESVAGKNMLPDRWDDGLHRHARWVCLPHDHEKDC
jgi:hypothetical protein